MNLKIVDMKNKEKGSMKLPKQFSEEVRVDVIARAVHAIDSHNRQPYGADPEAGKKSSAELSRRRRKYRGSYGHGISRVPRKILSRRGTRFNWVGAFAPGTVGGRRAHPPKAEKIWSKKINDKERQKAIRSALSATIDKSLVELRGHKIPSNYPFAISDEFEAISKTKDVLSSLNLLGFSEELDRSKIKKIRAGRGKSRGRRYNKKTGLLLVVSDDCALTGSAINIPGVDVVKVNNLNVSLLAPGTDVGRATLFTESALKSLEENNLFFPKIKIFKDLVKVLKKPAKEKIVKKATSKSDEKEVKKPSAKAVTNESTSKKDNKKVAVATDSKEQN